jgi:hypothetical protein
MSDELEAIRARHEACENEQSLDWIDAHGPDAHADRATLLHLLDAARAALQEQTRYMDKDEQAIMNRALLAQATSVRSLTRAQGESS